MKHFFTALCILLGSVAIAQNRYEIITEALCWTVGAVDSSLMRVVLQSTRTSERITLGYYNAQGTEITVAGGTLALGWCNNCTIAAVDDILFFEARGTAVALLSQYRKSTVMTATLVQTTPIDCLPMLLKEMRESGDRVKAVPAKRGERRVWPPHYFACLTRRKFLHRHQDYYLA